MNMIYIFIYHTNAERAVKSVKGRGRDHQLPDGQAEQTEGKYAGNGVGLQLKIMQLIHVRGAHHPTPNPSLYGHRA